MGEVRKFFSNNSGESTYSHAANAADSDVLHNKNCNSFLNHVVEEIKTKMPGLLPRNDNLTDMQRELLASFHHFLDCFKESYDANKEYKMNFAYGNLYTAFLMDFSGYAVNLVALRKEWLATLKNLTATPERIQEIFELLKTFQFVDQIVHAIYVNPNKALKNASKVIKEIRNEGNNLNKKGLNDRIRDQMSKVNNPLNYYYPSDMETLRSLFWNNAGISFFPQGMTSLPVIKKYKYMSQNNVGVDYVPQECRFGTQVRIVLKNNHVDPTYELWLQSLQIQRWLAKYEKGEEINFNQDQTIDHVYFNNLKSTGSESVWTSLIHGLDDKYDNHATITLSANAGLVGKDLYKEENAFITPQKVRELCLRIMTEKRFPKIVTLVVQNELVNSVLKDPNFQISPKVRGLLYADDNDEVTVLTDLINKSLSALNYQDKSSLTKAELQAVFFYLTRFAFPKFVFEKLKPQNFNMTCKDAIDRGGITSAYFNLMQSVASGHTMSEKEFDYAVHAAPIMVKGRAMNAHFNVLWNSLFHYAVANQQKIEEEIPWLTSWLKKYQIVENFTTLSFDLHNRIKALKDLPDRRLLLQSAEKLKDCLVNRAYQIRFSDNEFAALLYSDLAPLFQTTKQLGLIPREIFDASEESRSVKFIRALNELQEYEQTGALRERSIFSELTEDDKKLKRQVAIKMMKFFSSAIAPFAEIDKSRPFDIGLTKDETSVITKEGQLKNLWLKLIQNKPNDYKVYQELKLLYPYTHYVGVGDYAPYTGGYPFPDCQDSLILATTFDKMPDDLKKTYFESNCRNNTERKPGRQ